MIKRKIKNLAKKADSSIGKTVSATKQPKGSNRIKDKISSITKKAKSTVGVLVKASKTVSKSIINKAKSTIGNVVKATKQPNDKIKSPTEPKNKEKKQKKAPKEKEKISHKLKKQTKDIKENGFFYGPLKGKVVTGANDYFIKNREEFIQSLNEEGKGEYGNTKFTNSVKKGLDLGEKIGEFVEESENYLEKSLNQMIKGSYAEDETNLLGTLGEIGVGCIPFVGQVADIREIVYDFQNWEWKWSSVGDLALDAVGFVPLVGDGVKALKKIPFKEVGNSIKKGKDAIPEAINSLKKGTKEFTDKTSKKEIGKSLKEIKKEEIKNKARSVKERFENVINQILPKENLAFAGIPADIIDDTPKKFSNNIKDITEEVKNPNMNNNNNNKAKKRKQGVNIASDIITDGSHLENGKLKPNIRYMTGEYNYIYETDSKGRICKFETDDLQLTKRTKRLKHAKNTPGKLKGDHAGHLAGDRFGGSPEIDNLVSQSSINNLSKYKALENKWAKALEENKKVEINMKIEYNNDDLRPSKFIIEYKIDGDKFSVDLDN
ncbi:DNA/RNA non-specific endonuclease [[Clostridium] colinum]|uniref:DNA/RNA non-specific endonuclease n=1 Tax=[Clostridium] colinum TaxID=36835 RepID=UPI00202412A6|nr:DNA/RNA non-specific endonuclease [[Clostridium] colinum]